MSITVSAKGFSLVELLVTVAILLILGGLSLTAFMVYQEQAYQRGAESMMNQARTALEAGKQDSEDFPDSLMTIDTTTPGPLTDSTARILMPGFVLSEHYRVFATHDPTCDDPACLEDYIVTRSCKVAKRVIYWRTYGGIEFYDNNSADPSSCS